MKIKDGYLLKEIAGSFVVVPVGAIDFDGVITLNETGAYIWKCLEKETNEDGLVSSLLSEYEIDPALARRDVAAFLTLLRKENLIDE